MEIANHYEQEGAPSCLRSSSSSIPAARPARRPRPGSTSTTSPYTDRNIKDDNPTKAELDAWIPASGLPLRRFFNTSGTLYRSLGVKKMLDEGLSEDEATTLLATDGMLVKRPRVLVDGVPLTPGFKPAEWEEKLL
jgi:arsenate reductase (glutaredoxin)